MSDLIFTHKRLLVTASSSSSSSIIAAAHSPHRIFTSFLEWKSIKPLLPAKESPVHFQNSEIQIDRNSSSGELHHDSESLRELIRLKEALLLKIKSKLRRGYMATNPHMVSEETHTMDLDADGIPTIPGRIAPPRGGHYQAPQRSHQPPRGYHHPSNSFHPQSHYHSRGYDGSSSHGHGPRPFTQPMAAGDTYSRFAPRPYVTHLADASNRSHSSNANHSRYFTRRPSTQSYYRDRDIDTIPEFVPAHRCPPLPLDDPHIPPIHSLHNTRPSHDYTLGTTEAASEYSNQSHQSDSSCHLQTTPDANTEGQFVATHPEAVWPAQQAAALSPPPPPLIYPPVLIGPHYVILFNANPNAVNQPPPNLASLPPNIHFIGQPKQQQPIIQAYDPNVGWFTPENIAPAVEYDYTAIFDPAYGPPPFLTEVGGSVEVPIAIPQAYVPLIHQPPSELPPMGTVYYNQSIPQTSFLEQGVPETPWTNMAQENGTMTTPGGQLTSEGTVGLLAATSTSSIKLNPKAPEFVPKAQQTKDVSMTQVATQTTNSVLETSWSEQMEVHDDNHGHESPATAPTPIRSSTPIFSNTTYTNPSPVPPSETPSRRRGSDNPYSYRGRGGYHYRGGRSWSNYDNDGRQEEHDYSSGYVYRGRGGRGRGSRGRGRGGRGRGSYYRDDYYSHDSFHSNHENVDRDGDRGNTSTPHKRTESARVPPPGPVYDSSGSHVTLPGPISYANALASGLPPGRLGFKHENSETTEFVNSSYRISGGRNGVQHGVWINSNLQEERIIDSSDFPAIESSSRKPAAESPSRLNPKGKESVKAKIDKTEKKAEEQLEPTEKEEESVIVDKECGDEESAVFNSEDANNNDDLLNKRRSPSTDIDAGDGVGIGDSTSNNTLNIGPLPSDGSKGEPA